MSSALNYVMGRLCGRGAIDIPRQILEVGFRDNWLDQYAPVTLENKILNWVIKDRVIRDMDLVHGEELIIDLSNADVRLSDNYARIYNIPPELTNNREIMSVISVAYRPYGQLNGYGGASNLAAGIMMGNDISTAAAQVMSSVSSIPNMSTSRVDLVGYNIVRVTDQQRMQMACLLRCYVTNENYLNNIVPRAYYKFAELCILAVKAFLYNHMIVTMGDHFLQRGQELGIFKEVVSGWSEAAQQYKDYLKDEWAVVAYTMDEDAYTRFLGYQVPIGL